VKLIGKRRPSQIVRGMSLEAESGDDIQAGRIQHGRSSEGSSGEPEGAACSERCEVSKS